MIGLIYLAAHLLADFPLQTDHMAANKFDSHIVRLHHCTVHWTAYLCAGLLLGVPSITALAIATAISITHFLIDTRRWADKKDEFEYYPIWVDQTMHITAIALILVLFL